EYEKGIREKGPVVEKLFNMAMKLAYNYNREGYNKGKGMQIFKKPIYALFDKIIY
ncbi:unnamed protein product, partial [marine sediment metagenome]